MPIMKHGYAPRQGRKGTTRAEQTLNAQVLAEEHLCWYCATPARPDDPLEVAHIVAWSVFGAHIRGNLHAAHRSCNRRASNL